MEGGNRSFFIVAFGAGMTTGEWRSMQSFDDEQKIHSVNPKKPHGDVRDYGHDFAFQTVEKLLQVMPGSCHFDIEAVNSIFHVHTSCLRYESKQDVAEHTRKLRDLQQAG